MDAVTPQELLTAGANKRGYIDPHALTELWFHTGTACNLACPFCLEGSKPGDDRLDRIRFEDARPFIDEAVTLGVRQFSFTGGEPFIVKDIVRILDYALTRVPCLVLTNGVGALPRRLTKLAPLALKPHALSLRISIDYLDAARHDAGRGAGHFEESWRSAALAHARGFKVSIARQMQPGEIPGAIDAEYRDHAARCGLPRDLTIVAFPDFGAPGASPSVPVITESCMTTYQTESTRREFMCAYSKMVVKQAGRMRVYACTLVDDDPAYDQGGSLAEALGKRVTLGHHRCYSCFKFGASCSETKGR